VPRLILGDFVAYDNTFLLYYLHANESKCQRFIVFAEIEFDNERELELRDEFYKVCGRSFA
jgi:hypothetical protein